MPGEDGAPPAMDEMVRALTGAFKSLSTSRAMPAMKLSKFRGSPQKAEDLSIREWINEYDDYCQYYKLDKSERVQVLVAHLVGPAKDEILCRDSAVRDDESKLKEILRSRFGRLETVQTLSSELYSRVQQEGESLADFSSYLIRLYDRMETISSDDEKNALGLLKDGTLTERFVKGVRDVSVQRELRRITIAHKSQSFLKIREAVLDHFQDADPTVSRARVRECEVEAARAFVSKEEPASMKTMQGEIAHLRDTLNEVVQTLHSLKQGPNPRQGSNTRQEYRCYNCGKTGHLRRDCPVPVKCYGCNGIGHIRRDCPKEATNSRDSSSVTEGVGVETQSGPRTEPTTNIRTVTDQGNSSMPDFVAASPTAIVRIAGVETKCILDTGAEASLMPQAYYEEHLLHKIGNLEGAKEGIRVSGVSGSDIPILGFLKTRVEACGNSADVGFLVVREGILTKRQEEFPIILGCNALRVLLQGENGDGSRQGDWDLVSRILQAPKITPSRTDGPRSALTTGDPVVVPPLTIRRVVCEVENANLHGKEVFVGIDSESSVSGKVADRSLDIFEGCCQVQGSQVVIVIANRGEKEVVLGKDQILGEVVEIKRQEEVFIHEQDGVVEVAIADVGVETGVVGTSQSQPNDVLSVNDNENVHICADGREFKLPTGVKLDHSPEEADLLAQLLHENRAVFAASEMDLGFCTVIPHEINTSDQNPIRLPYRRVPPSYFPEMKQLLQEMLEKGIIRRSCSPYASPVVPVRKKDGTMRICIDYRQLNSRTMRDSFPLPRIDETLEALGGAKYFSSLDLANGYFQIAMDEKSISKTAFRVPWGLFEFLRMPQGLVNSPGTFQRVMELVLGELNMAEVIFYLDDILVFSSTLDEHMMRLKAVFRRLSEYGLKLKGKKCQFIQREVHVLGHVVTSEGIRVDQEKVEKVKSWPVPSSAEELRSFLGLASYYRRFMPGFADIAVPLHSLVGKTRRPSKKSKRYGKEMGTCAKFEWGKEEDESFNMLKGLLVSAPVLAYPQFGKDFIVEVDASLKGLGACLSQYGDDGKLHPIIFASRGLRCPERNYPDYSSFKLELLGLKWAVAEKFREYLIGSHTIVLTDNNPLAYLQTAKLGATEQRWVAQLTAFDIEIKYRPGSTNKCADALSRHPSNMHTDDVKSVVVQSIECSALPVELTHEQNGVRGGSEGEEREGPAPAIFPSYTPDQLRQLQENDDALRIAMQCWKDGWKGGDPIPGETPGAKAWLREVDFMVEKDGVVFRRVPVQGDMVDQLLVPSALRETILQAVHDKWGHQGVTRTQALLRERCYWPGLKHDVRQYIKRCLNCNVAKACPSVKVPMRHLMAFRPLEVLAIDFLQVERGKGGYENILVMTDVYTKYAQAAACRDQCAVTVARVLRDTWFSHYGIPLRIHSDQGRDFEGQLIHELCILYKINKSRTTPYHPEGNGQVERFNQTLCTLIRSLEPNEKRKWPEMLFHLVYIYNSTPHRVTGYSPFRLMHGRDPCIPVDQLLCRVANDWNQDFVKSQADAMTEMGQVVEENIRAAAAANKKRHDRGVKPREVKVGQNVLLRQTAFKGRHKLADRYHREKYVVVWVNPEGDVCTIRPVHGGQTKTVNVKYLTGDPRPHESCDVGGTSSNVLNHIGEETQQVVDDGHGEEGVDESCDEDEENFIVFSELPANVEPPSGSTSVRRSLRSNKGIHSNPAHWPRPISPH